jgi:16S rRNA (guanine527-N7)-methyltransferase
MPPDPLLLPNLSIETQTRLHIYVDLLVKWQTKINLVSPNTVPDLWQRHFEDSLQLIPLLPKNAFSLYDLGSGAGFPGLALAIAYPHAKVTLIESDSKKCAFLQTVSRETSVSVKILNERIEKATATLSAPNIVTARALAPLSTLLSYITPWLNPNLKAIFPKGESALQELEDTKKTGWTFDSEIFQSRTSPQASVLLLSNIHRKETQGL